MKKMIFAKLVVNSMSHIYAYKYDMKEMTRFVIHPFPKDHEYNIEVSINFAIIIFSHFNRSGYSWIIYSYIYLLDKN